MISNKLKIYLGILIVIIIAAASVEIARPTPIDWRETYNERQSKPYDLEVLHQELDNIIKKGDVKNIYRTPYEYFYGNYDWENYKYKTEGTYMSVSPDFSVDEQSVNELIEYANAGNTVFVSSYDMTRFLSDSLNFSIQYDFDISTKATFAFVNYHLENNESHFPKGIKNIYFSEIDTLKSIVLGYHQFEKDSTQTRYTNFIEVPSGKGKFLLHTQPIAFTNYYLLKDNHHEYAEGVFAYIPNGNVYFDSQNKVRNTGNNSKLRFIMSQPPLRWAWYLGLLFLLIFILFNAKRKQRIVKVIKPLENTTVDFTKTIGNLFYETKDHQNVVHKKITYFLEYLRTEYFMDTQVLDEKFCKRLHQKSGKPLDETTQLIQLINILKKKMFFAEEDVLKITTAIERFRQKTN
jgi:hypothetical protein